MLAKNDSKLSFSINNILNDELAHHAEIAKNEDIKEEARFAAIQKFADNQTGNVSTNTRSGKRRIEKTKGNEESFSKFKKPANAELEESESIETMSKSEENYDESNENGNNNVDDDHDDIDDDDDDDQYDDDNEHDEIDGETSRSSHKSENRNRYGINLLLLLILLVF